MSLKKQKKNPVITMTFDEWLFQQRLEQEEEDDEFAKGSYILNRIYMFCVYEHLRGHRNIPNKAQIKSLRHRAQDRYYEEISRREMQADQYFI